MVYRIRDFLYCIVFSIILIISTQEMPFLIKLMFLSVSILHILFKIIVVFDLIFYVNKYRFFSFLNES